MYFVETSAVEGLGNRSYPAGGRSAAVAVDPPRDVDRVPAAAAARRGVRITHVVESHSHHDYATGGLELARVTGARYLIPAGADVAYSRTPVADGDLVELEDGLALRAVATPGHTPHHTAYVLGDSGVPAVDFTGGSLLIGTVGRPGLDDIPAYCTHMGPGNTAGPAPADLTEPRRADPAEPAGRLTAGREVVAVDDGFDALRDAGLANH